MIILRIYSISFKNFKSFKDEVTIVLKDINYIIGPNGAGKSNIFHGIRVLSNILNNNSIPVLADYFDSKSDENMLLSCTVEMSVDDLYKIFPQTHGSGSDFLRLVRYRVIFNNDRLQEVTLEVTDRQGDLVPFTSARLDGNEFQFRAPDIDFGEQQISTADGSRFSNTNPTEILSQFSKLSSILLSPMKKLLGECAMINNKREPRRSVKAHETSGTTLDGSNMPNEINSLGKAGHTKLDETLAAVSSDDIKEIGVKMEGENNVTIVSEDGLENFSDYDRLSSGQKQMTYLSNLLTRIPHKLVMVEEPELHMHAKAQKKLLQLFRERSTDRQLIIETHSPIFANVGNNESTFLVTKNDGRTEVFPIDDSNIKQIRLEMGITHSDYFDNDILCIVEGDSEHASLPIFAKKMGYETGIRFRWWNLGGYGNIKNLRALLKYLNSSDRKIFLLLDKNNEAQELVNDLIDHDLIEPKMYHVLDKSFEDMFPTEQLIEITDEFAHQQNAQFDLSVDELHNLRENRHVDNILQEHWHTSVQEGYYPKKKLAEKLAERDAPTDVSNLIKKIMERCGVDNPSNSS